MPFEQAAHRVWEAALGRLQLQVPRPSFDTWLRNTAGTSMDEQRLSVSVPSTFAAEWLERRLQGLIDAAASAVAQRPLTVTYVVAGAESAQREATAPPSAAAALPPSRPGAVSTLNAKYTFDRFIVGGCNRLAHAAAMAVCEEPGKAYNPLFIHGGVGLGKTHLLHAIGHRMAELGHHCQYVTTEQFTNEFTTAIRDRRMADFRDRYRAADVLLVDDIQFISGKEGTQEGFFHTFNALHDANRQIVIASDRPPAELALLEERLRSRFEWGLLADIGMPDFETRLAILRTHARHTPVAVDDEVLARLASAPASNIRQIEGQLNRLVALAHFTNRPVTMALADEVLDSRSGTSTTPPPPVTPSSVIDTVARFYKVPAATITDGTRTKAADQARLIAMYLIQATTNARAEEIARLVGNRNRTSVVTGIKRLQARLATDDTLQAAVAGLRATLTASNTAQQQAIPVSGHSQVA